MTMAENKDKKVLNGEHCLLYFPNYINRGIL